ncbi:MAG: hypothetical protein IJC20_02935 [Clostridia bacterium]|nr:hypothetical protein [Clostridia bacterium]
MKGKNRCKILKDIRRRIAEENGIAYVTEECKYKGDCSGTCPKCESEVRYLERELERRRSLGYKVTVAGLAAGITLSSVGCTPDTVTNGSETLMGDYSVETSAYSRITSENSSVGDLIASSATVGDLNVDDSIAEPSDVLSEHSEYSDEISNENSSEDEVELMGEAPDYDENFLDEIEEEFTGDIAMEEVSQ